MSKKEGKKEDNKDLLLELATKLAIQNLCK